MLTSSHFKLIFAPWEISGILHSVGGTPELCLYLIPLCGFGGLADFGCPWRSWFLCIGRLLCRSPLGRTSGFGILLSLRDRLALHPVILLGVGCICLFTLVCAQLGVPSRFWFGDSISDFLIVLLFPLPCNGLLRLCSQDGISLMGRGKGSSNETKLEVYGKSSVRIITEYGDQQLTRSLSSFQRKVLAWMENGDGDRECKEGGKDEEEAMSEEHG
jgi:hypothetical protein